jgi:hypothetical protein
MVSLGKNRGNLCGIFLSWAQRFLVLLAHTLDDDDDDDDDDDITEYNYACVRFICSQTCSVFHLESAAKF